MQGVFAFLFIPHLIVVCTSVCVQAYSNVVSVCVSTAVVQVDGSPVRLQLCDTAGQVSRSLTTIWRDQHTYNQHILAMIVFSVSG